MKKPVNSRAKGATGEREFAAVLTELKHPSSRGQQFRGGSESPDVVCPSLPWIHWEVKRMKECHFTRFATVAEWDAQAMRDCGTRHPVIAHRWNGSRQWWVRVTTSGRGPYWQTLEDFLKHCEELPGAKAAKNQAALDELNNAGELML